MERLALACTCLLTAAVAVGQGNVYFRNKIAGQVGAVDAPFFDEQGTRLEGPDYVAQLYAWKAGDGFTPVGSPVPFATNGYFLGDDVLVPFVQACGPAWVQVRAWWIPGGATFEQAVVAGGWTGVSGVLFLPLVGGPRPEACGDARLIGLEYPGSPLVVRQPQSHSVRWAQRATLSVIATSGVTMSYQWYQDPSDRPDGMIVGATNATYLTPSLRTNTTFWVAVANGKGSALSDRATITVVGSPPHLSIQVVYDLPMLTLDGVYGQTYRLESSPHVSATNWTILAELALVSSPFTFVDTRSASDATRLYRAVVP